MRPSTAIVLVFVACGAAAAQRPSCEEVTALAQMVRSKSAAALVRLKRQAGDSYRAKIVFAFRRFELKPTDVPSARAVLDLIPNTEEQDSDWHTFGDSLCDSETVQDMAALSRLGDRLPHDLARAVLLVPDKMPEYVSYARLSVQDPHGDYAERMRAVCRAKRAQFLRAVGGLAEQEKTWFVSHVFNPDGCQPLALPEAE